MYAIRSYYERQAQEAVQRRNAAEARSNALDREWNGNEQRIAELNELLSQHQGNRITSYNVCYTKLLRQQLRDKAQSLGLAELFGLARQVANDTSSILQQSLITTQFPTPEGQLPRDEFLRQFAARITSYNVCYTKLLRHNAHSIFYSTQGI